MELKVKDNFHLKVYSHILEIDKQTWMQLKNDLQFYQSYDFIRIIEELHPDLNMRYALVYNKEKLCGLVYTQQLLFSYRHILSYSNESGNKLINALKKMLAGKNEYLLSLGDVFFTGDNGIISNQLDELLPIMPDILSSINTTFTKNKSGAFLMANINVTDESKCIFYKSKKYHPFVTEPDMYMFIREDWFTFDDYLNALTAKYRTRAKKVLAVSATINTKILDQEDWLKYKEDIARLYANVMDKTAFNLARINPDFFIQVLQQYPENCTLKGYFLNDKLVAFVCLFACNDQQLHVHYIGLDYEVNATHKLYNRMLLEFVRFAIENKFTKIHFGRTATEIKSTIGAQAMPLMAYLKMNNKLFNLFLPTLLKRIQPQAYTLRNPFK